MNGAFGRGFILPFSTSTQRATEWIDLHIKYTTQLVPLISENDPLYTCAHPRAGGSTCIHIGKSTSQHRILPSSSWINYHMTVTIR